LNESAKQASVFFWVVISIENSCDGDAGHRVSKRVFLVDCENEILTNCDVVCVVVSENESENHSVCGEMHCVHCAYAWVEILSETCFETETGLFFVLLAFRFDLYSDRALRLLIVSFA